MLRKRPGYLTFRCNICDSVTEEHLARFGREDPTCGSCRSSVRMRTILHGLSLALFGEPLSLGEFPEDRGIRGIGLSDWETYSSRLEAKLGYTNTYYHCEPRLDITSVDRPPDEPYDFLIASDVFEHVAPPVDAAFANARRLLKDSGVLVFSVPFQLDAPTVEHFPDLHEYALDRDASGYVLRNRTRDGRDEEFRDLTFHGGLGSTLEMRVFGQQDLMQRLERAGFPHVFPLNQPYFEFGIVHAARFSYPLLASAQPLPIPAGCFDWAVPGESRALPPDVAGISQWGPASAPAGEQVVLWFTGQHLRAGELRVLIGGQPLADVVTSAAADTLTSTLPDELTRHPGKYTVEVTRNEKPIFTALFQVRPGSGMPS
ncbi:MAG: methyltransferase domain-containing protein [Bryobacteraceae bacterium]